MVAVPPVERRRGPYRAELPARPGPGDHAGPDRRPGAAGLVLTRLTADHDLERALDGIKLAPGFSYAEERVGTNGIGTALESGGPAHVFGHEHYAETLEGLACAGVPIHDPF